MTLFILVGVLLKVVAALSVLAFALPFLVGLTWLPVDVFVIISRHLVLFNGKVAIFTLVWTSISFAVI